jgi:hypothetical protein
LDRVFEDIGHFDMLRQKSVALVNVISVPPRSVEKMEPVIDKKKHFI